ARNDIPIRISSTSYPVRVTWKIIHDPANASLMIDGRQFALNKDGSALIDHANSEVSLHSNGFVGSERPAEFSLEQNYPNPFNPRTDFGFRISEFGFVSLKSFDLLGQEIATI